MNDIAVIVVQPALARYNHSHWNAPMKTASLCLVLPALALAACNSSNNDQQRAATAAAAAGAGAAQPQASETIFVIGGGAGVTVDSVTEIQFNNPYEGLTFSSFRRIGQDEWETDTGYRVSETAKTADGFVLGSGDVQIVVDLGLAEVKISVGSGSNANEYGPYDIVMAR